MDVGGTILDTALGASAPTRPRRIRPAVKRSGDLLMLPLILVLVLPLLLVLLVALYVSSPGPLFFSQERVGRSARPFRLWKIRTMVPRANEQLEHILADPERRLEWEATRKLKDDPRVLPIGRLMRKYSLDEIPQLWNVLKGDMSLVGPRPIVRDEMDMYGSALDDYLAACPGLTGYWQTRGRNDTSYSTRVELDSYYVWNWSPWLDLQILLATFGAVFGGKGAY